MTESELSVIPVEARPYQGAAAGMGTRLLACMVDALLVLLLLLGGYAGYLALRLVLSPRTFKVPDASIFWSVGTFLGVAVVYLTASWWIGGRTVGDRVMGIRVMAIRGTPLRLPRAFIRSVFYTLFPVGLFWCTVDPKCRSLQDLVLRTCVIYDWLPRATNREPRTMNPRR